MNPVKYWWRIARGRCISCGVKPKNVSAWPRHFGGWCRTCYFVGRIFGVIDN